MLRAEVARRETDTGQVWGAESKDGTLTDVPRGTGGGGIAGDASGLPASLASAPLGDLATGDRLIRCGNRQRLHLTGTDAEEKGQQDRTSDGIHGVSSFAGDAGDGVRRRLGYQPSAASLCETASHGSELRASGCAGVQVL